MLKNCYDMLYVADAHIDTATACGSDFYINPKCQADLQRVSKFLNLQIFAFWQRPQNKPWSEWQSLCRSHTAFTDAVLAAAGVEILRSGEELCRTDTTWAVLALEGADCFAWLRDKKYFFDYLQKAGFKIIGLFWNNDNWLGCGADSNENPAADFGMRFKGKKFLADLAEYPFVLDLAHSSRRSFFEAAAVYQKPFMVSHSCCAALCPHKRNLTDEQLRLLGKRNGFLGIAFYPYFLNGTAKATAEDICEHIKYAVNLAGGDTVGLGSDFDGMDILPVGMTGCESLPLLAEKLHSGGLKYDMIEKIMGLNLKRFLQNNL